MLYVDCMGNFMSNIKLAFYDSRDESGFFSSLFGDSGQKNHIASLTKAYDSLTEVYEDLLLNVKIKQSQMKDFDRFDRIAQVIKADKSLDEIRYPKTSVEEVRQSHNFFSTYHWEVL